MQKEKNQSDMVVVAQMLSFLAGILTAIKYFELGRQIPTWDWGIHLGVVLGLISAGLAFAVSRHPGASGAALTAIGLLLLVMGLTSVGNLEPLIHGWRGAFKYTIRARPWLALSVLSAGICALVGNRELNPRSNFPDTPRLPLAEAAETEVIYPDPRYPTLQHALDALLPGGRLVVGGGGEHLAGITITKRVEMVGEPEGSTLRAPSDYLPVISLVAGAELLLQGLIIIGGDVGVLAGANTKITIECCAISENWDGVKLKTRAKAEIRDSIISENWCGVSIEDFAEATIEGNKIIKNKDHGVVLYQRPCYDTNRVFAGHVSGKNNVIPGPGKLDGNGKGAVCPEDLSFLMTQEGGELNKWK